MSKSAECSILYGIQTKSTLKKIATMERKLEEYIKNSIEYII